MKAGKVVEEILKEPSKLLNKPLYFFSSRQSARVKRVGVMTVKGEQRITVEADLREDEVLKQIETKCNEQFSKWIDAKKYATSTKGVNQEEVERIKFKAMKELAESLRMDL